MVPAKVEKLFELIIEIVTETDGKSWQNKRDDLLKEASEDDKMYLEEFVGWFDSK